MSDWTDEEKAEVIKQYEAKKPTYEQNSEIVAELADSVDKTPNGVRAILVKAGVYVKKDPTTKAEGDKKVSTRVNKADAIAALDKFIKDKDLKLDDTITSKLTGKAAVYFTELFETLTK